jgi:hypothetical protein
MKVEFTDFLTTQRSASLSDDDDNDDDDESSKMFQTKMED